MENNQRVVNSWNEWDQLKHVIVGTADKANIPPMEPALEPKISEDSGMKGSHGARSIESIKKLIKFQSWRHVSSETIQATT